MSVGFRDDGHLTNGSCANVSLLQTMALLIARSARCYLMPSQQS